MITVIGVKKIQLLECVSASFGFLAKRRNHPRNGRQRENPTFYESIKFCFGKPDTPNHQNSRYKCMFQINNRRPPAARDMFCFVARSEASLRRDTFTIIMRLTMAIKNKIKQEI
jgi:hypothetical protein